MPSLKGVAEKWENNATVRSRVRLFGTALSESSGGGLPHANVKQCAKFRDVVAPLVTAVVASPVAPGKLGIFTVHQAECELTKLYRTLKAHVDVKQVKAEAWLCKKFVVLLKRKKQRRQVPRCGDFRHLLSLLDGEDPDEDGGVGGEETDDNGDGSEGPGHVLESGGSVDEDASLHDSDVELLSGEDDAADCQAVADMRLEDDHAAVVIDDDPPQDVAMVDASAPAASAPVLRRSGAVMKGHTFEGPVVDVEALDVVSCGVSLSVVPPLVKAAGDNDETQPLDAEVSVEVAKDWMSAAELLNEKGWEPDMNEFVTRRQQLAAVQVATTVEETEGQPKAKAKGKAKMKRPAAAAKASAKKRKGSAELATIADGPPERPQAALSELGVPLNNRGEDEKANDSAEPVDMEAEKDKAGSGSGAKPNPKAKAKGKAKAKAKGKVKPCESEASDGDVSDDNRTVHFDENPLHAAFYKGPEDVPRPPSSPEHSEPESAAEAGGDGVPKAKGRGRGRGKGKGRGRGPVANGSDGAPPELPRRGRGRGRGKAFCAKGRVPHEGDEDESQKTFARRRMPSATMNKNRFLAIRDAFDTIIRNNVPKFPSKQEDLSSSLAKLSSLN
ncbi:unnamed protein product [Symbiodinium necroappetens]|uniref:Uncharacterized protein n=1 Tax=Symbiodinium necroappetens TaxID=1628268 RepID=A0A812ZU34_9DINO|nr:unnamed protein product [Symbiodinium necroappetens]